MNGTLSIPGDYATGAIKAIPDPYYYAADDKLRRDSRISELLDMDAQGDEAEAQSGVSHQSGVNQLSAIFANQQKLTRKTATTKADRAKVESDIQNILSNATNTGIGEKAMKFIFAYGTKQDIAALWATIESMNAYTVYPDMVRWFYQAQNSTQPYNWNA